jgi:hypothetical protein
MLRATTHRQFHQGVHAAMETSRDAKCIQSDLVDVGLMPLAASKQWRDKGVRVAMKHVMRDAGKSQVCDNTSALRHSGWAS